MTYYLASDAVHYAASKGFTCSVWTIRLAVDTGELHSIRTVGGARVIEQKDLNEFIIQRQAKNKPANQLKAA